MLTDATIHSITGTRARVIHGDKAADLVLKPGASGPVALRPE